jgi:outer membrane protein assembly factor BamB
MYAPVVGSGDIVYVGTNDGYFYALDPDSGVPMWEYPNGNWTAAAIDGDGYIYKTIGGGQYDTNAIDCIDANGAMEWRLGMPGYGNFTSVAYRNGTAYFAWPYNRNVYALDASNGTALWSARVGNGQFSTPAVSPQGTVFVGSENGSLYALDGENGSLLWTYDTGHPIWTWASPLVGPDGAIYIGSDGLHTVKSVDGTLLWRNTEVGEVYGSLALGADGTLFCGSRDGYAYAVSSADGLTQWRFEIGSSDSSPAIDGANTVYIGSHDGYLYALDGDSGALRWRYSIGLYGGSSSPVIGSDGTLYVTGNSESWEYQLYALSGE